MNIVTKRLTSSFATYKDTCLKELHLARKGKIVGFAGYNLPVQYPKGIVQQHLHCRSSAALFDVSHMGQMIITGPDTLKLLQRVTVGKSKGNLTQCYLTLFLNEQAGIIDDAIASYFQKDNTARIVVNASNKYIDLEHVRQVAAKEGLKAEVSLLEDHGLVALQGPKSQQVLQALAPQIVLKDVPFMTHFKTKVAGEALTITRSGYTGEDGFELGGPGPSIVKITQKILQNSVVELAGLGSRDSLRLEAGLCLHGHEMSTTTTPLQAALMWTVHKSKAGDSRLPFIGQQALTKLQADVKQKKKNIHKRVGFQVNQTGIPRDGCKIFSKDGQQIGKTTSGGPSPSLKKSIGMAYVASAHAKQGSQLLIELRGKKLSATVVKMPFVPSTYYERWP